jgi:HAD superfamily hydrolase (TIGR01509 family)
VAISGRLVRGLGQAAAFTRLGWVRQQFIDSAGIDPHPGTVNLEVLEDHLADWKKWRALPGEPMESPDAACCSARSYPVRIEGRLPGAIVLPQVPDYPEHKLEFVAALPVRARLALAEGAHVRLETCAPLVAKAVLFDLDGTLVDSIGAYLEVARVAAMNHGLEVTELHVRQALCSGTNFWKGVIADGCEDGEALRKALFSHAAREWPRILSRHGKPFPGLAATLDELRSRDLALGIVSGARPEVLELLHDVLDRFDAVVLGPDVAQRKPHPEGLLKCLQQLGCEASDALYVGDTPIDIEASRAAGMRAVGVLSGAGDSAVLSACEPDRLISSHVRLPAILSR